MRIQAVAALSLLLAAGAHADTLLTIKMRLETTPSPPPPADSPKDMETQYWVGDHRLREDTPQHALSVIRRFDRRKLYFVDHRAKTYAEIDLPFDPLKGADHRPPKPAAAGDIAQGSQGPKAQMTVTLTDETRRIGSWNTRKVVVVSRHPKFGEATAVKWMSTEVGVDESTLKRWQDDAVVLPAGILDAELLESQRQLDAIPGYPVLEETTSSLGPGETEYRWHKELVSAETKEPPAGTYDPPAGYTKVEVDQIDWSPADRPRP